KLKLAAALMLMASAVAAAAVVGYQPATGTQAARNDDSLAADNRKIHVDAQGDPLPAGAIARLGTVRLRHGYAIFDAALSPDGKLLASAGAGRGVCIWDAATGKELRSFLPKWNQHVHYIAFSPDGKLLAGSDGPVHLWDVATGEELH